MPTKEETLEKWEELGGNVTATAKYFKVGRSQIQRQLKKMGIVKPAFDGRIHDMKIKKMPKPKRGVVKRYLITSCQNNSKVFDKFWDNLLKLREYHDAEILISQYTYNKAKYNKNSIKPGTAKASDTEELWYDSKLEPYICNDPIQLAHGLVYWGNMNTLPTSMNPLAGFDQHGARQSGIFPHTRMEMKSIPSFKGEGTKFLYTTGTVTLKNYIQKNAGIKAEFHHVFGALIVEVNDKGHWYVRQLNGDSQGTIYDLDLKVEKGIITTGNRVEAINPGDIHASEIDKDILLRIWLDSDGVMETLRPKYQFLHDVLAMRSRSHHDMKSFHKMFEKHIKGEESVEEEFVHTHGVLSRLQIKDCKTVVVRSNHDCHAEQWLNNDPGIYCKDLLNARFFLEAQLAKVIAIENGDHNFKVLEWGMKRLGNLKDIKFLNEDESFIICKSKGGGIECGMHGHLGVGGARGNPKSLSKVGRRANTGHTHNCGIYSGLYVAGTCSSLDLGYNRGPSNWSHSLIVTYPNGKRTIITFWDKEFRG